MPAGGRRRSPAPEPGRPRLARGLPAATAILLAGLSTGCSLRSPLPSTATADSLLVEKAAHRLTLFNGDTVLRRYTVALSRHPVGDKVEEGDQRVPEGRYRIDSRLAGSAYHRALHLSYPDSADRREAAARGVSPGGQIMIHGLPNGFGWVGPMHRLMDWTAGCVAVTDAEIEELWRVVPQGAAIVIVP